METLNKISLKDNEAFKIFVLKINLNRSYVGRKCSYNIKNISYTKNKAIMHNKS